MNELSIERFKQLAENNGWSLAFAQGHVDGEKSRRLGQALAVHARVGIDQYSLGFRAGYFDRRNVNDGVGPSEATAGGGTQGAETPLPRPVRRKLFRVL